MKKLAVIVGAVGVLGCPKPLEPTPPECTEAPRSADAGTHWRHVDVELEATPLENLTAESTDGGTRLSVLDAGVFRFSTASGETCPATREWTGVWASAPFELPKERLDLGRARPDVGTQREFHLRSLVDDELAVTFESSDSRFVPMTFTEVVPGRLERGVGVVFRPTYVGRFEADLTLRTDGWSGIVGLTGESGGGVIIAPSEIDAGVVAAGDYLRPDIREFVIRNDAPAAEHIASVLKFGTPDFGPCRGFSFDGLPAELPPQSSADVRLFVDVREWLGPFDCDARIPTDVGTLAIRVRGEVRSLRPCGAYFPQVPITSDGGWATFEVINFSDTDCYLTAPRFEPRDAGFVDLPWSHLWLLPQQTLSVPVFARESGTARINSNSNPQGMISVEVLVP